jgi:hypothetical protein
MYIITAANQTYTMQSETHTSISSNRCRVCSTYRVGTGEGAHHGVVGSKEARGSSRPAMAMHEAVGISGRRDRPERLAGRDGFVNWWPGGEELKCASGNFGLSQYNSSGLKGVRCHYLSLHSVVN